MSDNAAMESFFSSLKTERIRGRVYRTRDEARADVFDYIERSTTPFAGTRPSATSARSSSKEGGASLTGRPQNRQQAKASSKSPSSSTPGRARSSVMPSAVRSTSADTGRPAHSHRKARAATRLHPPHGPRLAICGRALPAGSSRTWPGRIDGAPRQSVRQYQGRELHEDAQGRGWFIRWHIRPSRMSLPTFRASSIRSTKSPDSTPRSAISVRSSSRINTPGSRS